MSDGGNEGDYGDDGDLDDFKVAHGKGYESSEDGRRRSAAGSSDEHSDWEYLIKPEDNGFSNIMEDVPCPSDTYGAFMMSLIRRADINLLGNQHKTHTAGWVVVAFLLHAVNIFIQISVATVLLTASIYGREVPYRENLNDRIHTLLSSDGPLAETDPAYVLCKNNTVQNLWVYPLMLFLWIGRMVQEISEIIWLFVVFTTIPNVRAQANPEIELEKPLHESSHELLAEKTARPKEIIKVEGTFYKPYFAIVAVPRRIKVWIALSVLVPKLLIGLWITWVGGKNLLYANHTGTCVIKAITLQWWINIDEMLFRSFASHNQKAYIQRSSFRFPKISSNNWNNIGGPMTRLLIAFICTLGFTFGGFHWQIYSFRQACAAYKVNFMDVSHVSDVDRILQSFLWF
eukprot:TRINITY_DN82489_c0_g1_i1.p1 TRINITY_DN82489_c0_g1~~TRINITY_DN82489_c0_g1_i1.p1  ORF type:complete len:423 (+),score=43.46 TRINITY_DN82489_c0_g1_i1:67-1269(+)